ncbi:MAG: glutamate synthase subunit alpha, partial [Candidatus Omnitrophica bacterium]|nr:glutamate synthase subunit alpha [Candidatus Omnitrophota bacterium]
RGLDFSKILCCSKINENAQCRYQESQDHGMDAILDKKLIELSRDALDKKKPVKMEMPIRNVNLSTGAMLSGEIARRYGSEGMENDTIVCRFTGAAGQSFGAFCMQGLTLILEGEANDYVGKGLCGGKIIVKPSADYGFNASKNVICGNVLLYGATSGEIYLCGCVGERFAIRNGGAYAIVERIGDHGCEYMTGGRVVILGETGVNFAAGMSGGIAYVYDPENKLDGRTNLDMVDLESVKDLKDIDELKDMIERHFEYTGSKKAEYILKNWEQCLPFFVKVFPMEYRRVLGQMLKEDEGTVREEVIFK